MLSFALLALTCVQQLAPDVDSDKDGLSDFAETHKYFTDPTKADTDGDGIPDGDWDERREYAYSVHAVIDVMAPFDVASMNDDYQDVRVLDQRPDLLEFEVVLYPLNTVASAIEPNANWRKPAAAVKHFLAPGICCNWDDELRTKLTAELKQNGIDLAKLDDVEAAKKVSDWLMKRSQFEDSFTTFAVTFDHGKPQVDEQQKSDVDATLKKFGRTLAQQWDRELFGKGMFETKVHGSCTSSAIYLSTCLKAIGLPTRTIVCVPIVDACDEREMQWITPCITNNRVRATILSALSGAAGSWTSHTFNEVFVGNRWRRLNYSKLGQNVLDEHALGLMVHVNTFADQSETQLVGWGNRNSHPLHDALFGGQNPYSCVSLSDRFGTHAKVDNPPAESTDVSVLTISRAYWYDDPKKNPIVSMRLDDPDTAGHMLVHVDEGRAEGGTSQYKRFYDQVGKEFVLRAKGQPDVRVHAARGYWFAGDQDVREFYLRIEPADFEHMARGVAYELAFTGKDAKLGWKVAPGVSITRAKN